MTAVTEIEAFEAGRTHEVSQFARRVGTGVEFPAVLWAESMNVGAPLVEGDPWAIEVRRYFHPFVRLVGNLRHNGQAWKVVDLEVMVDDFETGDPEELGKIAAAITEATALMESER